MYVSFALFEAVDGRREIMMLMIFVEETAGETR
jgi:hypothetical protein